MLPSSALNQLLNFIIIEIYTESSSNGKGLQIVLEASLSS